MNLPVLLCFRKVESVEKPKEEPKPAPEVEKKEEPQKLLGLAYGSSSSSDEST